MTEDITERMEKLLGEIHDQVWWDEACALRRFDEANDDSAGRDFDRESPPSLVQDMASSRAILSGRV